MRRFLLWMARNPWLKQKLPRLPFARRAVRRFMPGESLADALRAASPLAARGQRIVLTALGENVTTVEEAEAVAEHYRQVLREAAAAGIPVEISVKPTHLGLDLDRATAERLLDELAAAAGQGGSFLWIDMEGSAYAATTVQLYERVRAAHERTGLCLQAYLRRTAADVQRLLPLRPAIRLVKGAYDEPPAIAYRRGAEVDANYFALAAEVARAACEGRARLALGTHDSSLVERIAEFAAASGVTRDRLEVHMLYGIRARELERLREEGFPVATLIAYGSAWYAWYMRRLAERPANVAFALRQLLP